MSISFKNYLAGFLLVISCISHLNSKSQTLSFDNTALKSMNIVKDSTKKSYLLLFCKKYYVKYDLSAQKVIDTMNYVSNDTSLDFENIVTNFRSLAINENLYFIENTGGGVYEFKNGSFKKIDNSYSHRLQFGAFPFVYNNKLHQYGGYGFFSNRDMITYFDTNTNSWEIVNPIKSDIIPTGTSAGISLFYNSNLFIFNGSYLDKFDRKKNHILKELWSFNFLNNKWKMLGKTIIDEQLSLNKYFQIENKIICLNYGGQIAEIDVENNIVKKFKKTNFIEKLSDNILPIYNNDYIYCIINNGIKNTLELHIRKRDDFLGDYLDDQKLYHSGIWEENKYLILTGTLLLLLTTLVILLYIKKKNSVDINKFIKINNQNVFYKNKMIDLDQSEVEIIKMLLDKPEGVSTSDIMNLTETKGLNYSHNIRQKNIKINNINLIFKATLKIDYDIIISSKSEFDQRMRIYKLVLKNE
jgi:hypothetical protein